MKDIYGDDAVPGQAWQTSFPDSEPDGDHQTDDRLRLSDLAKLARRTQRGIVGVARAGDRPTFTGILAAHLSAPLEDLEVVEESWPTYDHVNVQVGLDAWLADPRRTHQLLGMTNFRHQEFGLTDLLRRSTRYGPMPGNVSWVRTRVRIS
jgi:hypothetical protein